METQRILIFYKSSDCDMMGRFHTMQSVREMLSVAAGTTAGGVSPGAGMDPAPPQLHQLDQAKSKREACSCTQTLDRHCMYDHFSILNAFFLPWSLAKSI